MIGTTVIHCADNANQSSDTITCCHIVAVTGASDVAPATVRVASSPAVITSAPNSGFVPSDRQSFDEGRPHLRCNDEETIELTMNRVENEIWLPFLDTYRTMCLAPKDNFRRVLEEVREMRLAA